MSRVKRGVNHAKKRRNLLKSAKGFRQTNKLLKQAKIAVLKAGRNRYRDLKTKKRIARRLWQVKINAAIRPLGINYSKFINKLKINKIELDRKILADIAENNPKIFKKIVEKVK